jgi:hypothetical protein
MLLNALTPCQKLQILSPRPPCRKGVTTVFLFKSTPLSSLLLITLLCLTAVMLIAPQTDPPDTAFQINSVPLAVHGLAHYVPHGKANNDATKVLFRVAESSNLALKDWSTRDAIGGPALPRRILRC